MYAYLLAYRHSAKKALLVVVWVSMPTSGLGFCVFGRVVGVSRCGLSFCVRGFVWLRVCFYRVVGSVRGRLCLRCSGGRFV